ncbi:hypothetical protein [Bradyrhizobium sp. RDM4]|uniref:hypothetical protein n=1 Tax=Bradyrhizobium sp. RDM4 TaxID=3378765 RepID=UPI0038FCB61A
MKWFALLCLFVFATRANAASTEQHYLDLRDRYITKFSKAPENDETSRQHDAALKELTGVLRGLVGPVAIKGLPPEGSSNVDTLFKGDSGFGHLDGLGFASEGDKMQAVVTTTALLKHWLAEHREDGMPQEIGAAFKSDRFYYQAIQDSAFAKYAELPIIKPAAAKTTEILACEKVWKQMMAKPVNKKDPRGDMTREDQAMDAMTACFAKEAPNQGWFAAAVKKAQAQLDLLPLR